MLEWIVPVTDVVVALLLMLLGGNLGSFLNVVVHRLPRGESVVTGGSRCPACGSAIRWHDNVPVLGWLLLRGRCRDCGTEIAPRYPLVEAAGALVLGGVAAVELLSGGATFPAGVLVGGRSGADNLLLRPDPGLIGVALFHAWVLFNLLLGAAIATDGGRVPRSWTAGVLALTVATVTAWDWLVPVGIRGDLWSPGHAGVWAGPVRGLLVSAVGIVCGWVVGARGFSLGQPEAVRTALPLVGAAVGWQGVVVVALFSAAVGWCRRRVTEATLSGPEQGSSVPAAGPPPEEVQETPEGGVVDGPSPTCPADPPAPESARVSSWRRLARAACEGVIHPGWAAGDVVAATASFFLLWRACVGLWPWKT